MKYLVVVDMQNDFITGSLGSSHAQSIVPNVLKKIAEWDGSIVATQDTHDETYLHTQEGSNLPVSHCIEGTYGWEIEHSIQALLSEKCADGQQVVYVSKGAFGSSHLANLLCDVEKNEPIDSIHIVGLCTDICVISNAMILKSYLPEVPIIVDAFCCAGVTPKSHLTALQAMKACQITIINE